MIVEETQHESQSLFSQTQTQTQTQTQNPQAESSGSSPATSPFLISLNILLQLLRTLTFHAATTPKSSSRDTVSCLFYNLAPKALPPNLGQKVKDTDTFYKLLDCNKPGGRDVVNVKNMIRLHESVLAGTSSEQGFDAAAGDAATFGATAKKITGSSALSALRFGMYHGSRLLEPGPLIRKSTASNPGDTRSMWLCTNNDRGGTTEREEDMIVQMCKDQNERGIDVELWSVPNPTGPPFDSSKFFNRIIEGSGDTDNENNPPQSQNLTSAEDVSYSMDDIVRRIKSRTLHRRRVASVPLDFPNFSIQVDLFTLTTPIRRPPTMKVNSLNNLPLVSTAQYLDKETGETVDLERDGETYLPLGEARVPFKRATVDKVKVAAAKVVERVGIKALGFKKVEGMILEERIGKSYFIQPAVPQKGEPVAETNRSALLSLHASMLKRNVQLICLLHLRTTGLPRIATMTAQPETFSEGGEQSDPPGFVLSTLPFEDDLRSNPSPILEASKGQVSQVKTFIGENYLSGVEWGYSFKNPALARFWSYISSVAEEGTAGKEEVVDETDFFTGDIELTLPEPVEEDSGKKRKAARSPAEKKAKQAKVLPPDTSGVEWHIALAEGIVAERNVEELKKFLRSRGAKLGGRKAELVDRVEEILMKEDE